ncbi:MAG: hypothetical protein IPO72_12500 [Saprospiraceae bacterium]|nr:hypothetical protein [Candidatus Vicinibacter affinis]
MPTKIITPNPPVFPYNAVANADPERQSGQGYSKSIGRHQSAQTKSLDG